MIAPVLDMERSGRRRRRRRGAAEGTVDGISETPGTASGTPDALRADDGTAEPAAVETEVGAESEVEPETAVREVDEVQVIDVLDVAEVKEDELVVVVEPERPTALPVDGGLDTDAVPVVVSDDPPPHAQAPAEAEAEPAAEVDLEPEAEVVAVAVVSEPATEADPAPAADDERPTAGAEGSEPPKWRFGKRSRP